MDKRFRMSFPSETKRSDFWYEIFNTLDRTFRYSPQKQILSIPTGLLKQGDLVRKWGESKWRRVTELTRTEASLSSREVLHLPCNGPWWVKEPSDLPITLINIGVGVFNAIFFGANLMLAISQL